MTKILALMAPIIYVIGAFMVSAWRTQRVIESKSSELDDRRLLQLNKRLANAAGIPDITSRVYEISQVNGLVLPNGKIYITRGLLKCYDREEVTAEEVSSVVAHEMGHVAMGHTRKRLSIVAAQNAAGTALAIVLNRFLPFIGGLIAQGLMRLLVTGISRSDELQADRFASALLIKAGIGTQPQRSLLKKLDYLTGDTGQGASWLSGHPSVDQRVKAIEDQERKWRQGRGLKN